MEKSKKLVVVINGKGGVGKDTLCESINTKYKIFNVSAITPIKEIAKENGWNGEKDNKSRKFLADLKKVFTEYNDLPTKYLLEQYEDFLESDNQVMFVHIREASEIQKFVNATHKSCVTLLIYNDKVNNQVYGNESDDQVDQYDYDYRYNNSAPLEQSKAEFLAFFDQIWENHNSK